MKRNRYLAFLLVLLLSACGETPLYENTYSFDDKEWSRDEKPTFTFQIDDIEKEYDFTITLRTTTDYKYSNLWIFLKTETPEGISAREPFQIQITDETGAWIGNKMGSVVETPLSFSKRKLPLKGEYKFTIEQGITQSTIDEVLDIGFRLDEAAGNN